jgi:hypothetical protein
VTTLQLFGATWKDTNNEGANREPLFVLLQLINALKSLQARGIEDANKSLNDVVLCREDKDICYRLYLLQRLFLSQQHLTNGHSHIDILAKDEQKFIY